MRLTGWVRIFAAAAAGLGPVWASDCRFVLADQGNWDQKLGFYLELENTAATGPCQLSTLTLALGVAGGGQWRFIVQRPAWQLNTEYTARAVIGASSAELWLNGTLLSRLSMPPVTQLAGTLSAAYVPGWASAPASYLPVQSGLSVTSTTGQSLTLDLQAAASRPPGLMAIAPGSPQSAQWPLDSGTWTVTATFRFLTSATSTGSPLFDRYLQAIDAGWAGKIRSDADLAAGLAEEDRKLAIDWPAPTGYDKYGGVLNAGWSVNPTGYYQVVRHDGRWWLITPLGNPCFYIGIDTAPALTWDCTPITGRPGLFAELPEGTGAFANDLWKTAAWGDAGIRYGCFNTANMIRKYGSGWKQTELDRTVVRVKAWGFSGLGKWSDQTGDLPQMPVLYRSNVPVLSRHPDVFDSSVQAMFRSVLASQITPLKNDPRIVGFSLGNEYDEIVTSDEVTAILALGATVAAKRAFVDEALAGLYSGNAAVMASSWGLAGALSAQDIYGRTPSPPAGDVEHLRLFYARSYYSFIYTTVKSIDPNHLYFGFWIVPGWWVNADDWRAIAPYCDVIGYDRYSDQFVDETLASLMREADKPVLAGEFSFPADYGLMRGFRTYGTYASDDLQSGVKYSRWVHQAATNPYCVGLGWFQYRDEPVSGRGPGSGPDPVYGESYAFGLVDVGDRPKWDLVEAVRTANLGAAQWRLTGAAPAIADGGVVNAASFAKGAAVAPGSLVSIFGAGLEAVDLSMGGYSVPVLYASANQVNAQVPWQLAGQTSAALSILGGNSVTVPLASCAPGIFAVVPLSGGNPVKAGDYLVIYANGLGPVSHTPATGGLSPGAPYATTAVAPSVTVGGHDATVLFSGLAPGWIGLYQVNVQVTPGTPSGTQPVIVSVEGVSSNAVGMEVE